MSSSLNAIKRQFKNELIKKYGEKKWFHSAKKDDFNLVDGKWALISKSEADKINKAIKPVSLDDAKINASPEYINSVTFDIDFHSDNYTSKTINITVSDVTKRDIKLLKDFNYSMTDELAIIDDLPAMRRLIYSKSADPRVANLLHVKESSVGAAIKIKNMKFYSFPIKYRSLKAFDSVADNCAIRAIARSLEDDQVDKLQHEFHELHTKFANGVGIDDYKYIAKKLNITLKVYFGMNDNNASMTISKRKPIAAVEIYHFNNHAMCKKIVDNRIINYEFVDDNDDLRSKLIDNVDRLFKLDETSVTFRNEDDTFTCYQLKEIDGVELELGKTSLADALLKKLTDQLSSFPNNSKNIAAYNSFVKHGVHYSTGEESMTDIDIDLEKAYSSYFKFDIYKGLPKDITNWVQFNDSPIDDIIAKLNGTNGFAYVTLVSPLHGDTTKTVWLLIPAVLELHNHQLIQSIKQAAFSVDTIDLDLTGLVDLNPTVEAFADLEGNIEYVYDYAIGKRVFHKLLGMLTKQISYKHWITKDPLENLTNNSNSLSVPQWAQNQKWLLENIRSVSYAYESNLDKYSHLTAAIQDYVFCQVTLEYLRLKSIHPDVQLVTSLVDGFRIKKHNLSNYQLSKYFSFKGITYNHTAQQNDWPEAHPLAESFVLEDDQINFGDYPAIIHNDHNALLANVDFMRDASKFNVIYGYAGCGKTYSIKRFSKQCHSIILTPTHLTRLDYINDGFNAVTHQAAQHNPLLIKGYQLIIIDEASMLTVADVNRIVSQLTNDQRMLLVGDPAQLQPFTYDSSGNRFILKAIMKHKDSLPFKIGDASLYQNDFDIERLINRVNILLSNEEKAFDYKDLIGDIDAAKKQHQITKFLFKQVSPSNVAITDIVKCKKILTNVKRSSDKQLTGLCKLVRSNKIDPNEIMEKLGYSYFVSEETEHVVCDRPKLTHDDIKGKRVLSYTHDHIESLTLGTLFDDYTEFMVQKSMKIKQNDETFDLYTNEVLEFKDGSFYSARYLTPIVNSVRLRNNLKPANITTFHKSQGQTIIDDIYINMSFITPRALYVALTRATKLSQIKLFVMAECQYAKLGQACHGCHNSNYKVSMKKFREFKDLTFSKIDVPSNDLLSQNCLVISKPNVDISKLLNDLPSLVTKYDRYTEKHDKKEACNRIKDYINTHYLINAEVSSPQVATEAPKKQHFNKQLADQVSQIIRSNNGQCTFKMDRPKTIKIESVDKYSEDEDVTYDYTYAVSHNDKRIFAWFYSLDDAKSFHEEMSKTLPECELHDVMNNDFHNFFMDIDYKIHEKVNIDDMNNHVINKLTTAFKSVVTEDVKLSFSQRSRYVDNATKISIHMYTNLACDMPHMQQIAKSIASSIDDDDIVDSIDMQPYAMNKSLSAPFGTKNGVKQTMVIGEYVALFNVSKSIIMDKYTVTLYDNAHDNTDESLLDEALDVLHECPLFDEHAMTAAYASRNQHCGHIRRISGSDCRGCGGHHSNDNTLRIYLHRGSAFAKCSRGGKSFYLCGGNDRVVKDDETLEKIESLEEELNDARAELEVATQDIDTERMEEMEEYIAELEAELKKLKQ